MVAVPPDIPDLPLLRLEPENVFYLADARELAHKKK
jgi:hypothetical protein